MWLVWTRDLSLAVSCSSWSWGQRLLRPTAGMRRRLALRDPTPRGVSCSAVGAAGG